MYVSRLDRPWLETRYLFQGFHISNTRDIEELRQHCEYVFVAPELGEPVELPTPQMLHKAPRDKFVELFKKATGHECYPIVTSVEEEIGACRESRKHTLDVVTNILEQLKAGQNIKLGSVRQAVNRMVSSIVRNPDAFFWLSRLKDKDNY